VPKETVKRCALHAQLRGDPMLGTAFPAARLLLVEQPGPWGRDGLRESHFDPQLAAEVEQRAADARVRVIAIRRPGRTPSGTVRRWAYADTRDGSQVVRWGEYTDDAELLDLPLDGSAGESDDQPVYLVCAHSKHDTCCALRGRPVAAALDAVRPGRVWECSHIGGERFAANVLLLPSGLMYGRVLPFAAPEFVAAADAGEVVGALLRGRIGYAPAAQAALAFGYEHLALRRADALQVRSATPVREGRSTVRLAGPHGELDVLVEVRRVRASGLTCASPLEGQYLAYQPVRIDPVLAE
jgi:hypothetical protein